VVEPELWWPTVADDFDVAAVGHLSSLDGLQ